jgi:hypothetical protein
MNKKILLVLLVCFGLLLTAQECSNNGGSTPNNRATFIGGTTGLSIQFTEDAPPAEVFDMGQDPFDVELKLLNSGEADIPKNKVKVVLSGLNPTDFGKTENDFIINEISQNVEKSYIDSQGNKVTSPDVTVTFSRLNYKGILTGNRVWPVWVDVCYGYETKAESDGCIKRDVRGGVKDSVCQVAETKKIENSGAPIQVVEFQEVAAGTDKVKYFFKIKHAGTGKVYNVGSRCGTDRTNENKVYFSVKSTVADLSCSGFLEGTTGTQGTVLLRDGEYTVRCNQEKVSQIDYVDPVSITLTYDYGQSIKQDILVKKNN